MGSLTRQAIGLVDKYVFVSVLLITLMSNYVTVDRPDTSFHSECVLIMNLSSVPPRFSFHPTQIRLYYYY